MRRLGSWAIYVGRFAGPLRAMIPLMAGVLSMPSRRFHLANALSGAAWVAVFMGPGYAAGRGLGQLACLQPRHLLDLGLAVAVVAVIAAGAWLATRRLARQTASACAAP